MKHMSTADFKIGDRCITKDGDIVTVVQVTSRMIEINEDLKSDKKLFIPAHGEINPIYIEEKLWVSVIILSVAI